MEPDPKPKISIAATFTSEPVAATLRYWMHELDLDGRVEFAPYNQVFQHLLEADSSFHSRDPGLNVVLLRFEDWMRGAAESDPENELDQVASEFIETFVAATRRASRPFLLVVCPSDPSVEARCSSNFARVEARLEQGLSGLAGAHLVTGARLRDLYPVRDYYDPATDELGEVPYTPAFFAALGTMITRVDDAVRRPPRKVIALDCDMTLWEGVCGEDGPQGVRVDDSRRALQRFMVDRSSEGMLLCLCSKNDEADVRRVFEQRPEMPLQQRHLVASRIDWQSKPENLRSLAEELGVGLDTFIFVDDDPVECAAVEAECPQVLTVRLPREPQQIQRLLDHVWEFDRVLITSEDRRRTSMYREEARRLSAKSGAPSLSEFLRGLELEVRFSQADADELHRAAQLTFRTNQMNFTTVRRSETDIRNACADEQRECHVVHVSDRFGEYGVVGVLILGASERAIDVDTFLLSCRALGRGVEHRMVARIGQLAIDRGLDTVRLPYRATPNNSVALSFLRSMTADCDGSEGPTRWFELPSEVAAGVVYRPDEGRSSTTSGGAIAAPSVAHSVGLGAPPGTHSVRQPRITRRPSRPTEITHAVAEFERRSRPESEVPYVGASAPIEEELVSIWSEVLNVDRVGVHDNFFQIGGDSLALTRIVARIVDRLGANVPLEAFFDAPTIAQLTLIVGQGEAESDDASATDAPSWTFSRSEQLSGPAPASNGVASITVLGTVTHGRQGLMERGVSSYVNNGERHGRECRYVVVDDSPSEKTQERCRTTLGRLATAKGATIQYAGLKEKARFADDLVRCGDLQPEVVRFALFGAEPLRLTPGANRNALLLDSIGEQVLSTDDDTVCRIGTVPAESPGVDLVSGRDPAEFWFFGDRQAAIDGASFVDADVLSIHEELLGRRVEDLVNGSAAARPIRSDERLGDSYRERLEAGDGRVAVTINGLLGDCGLGAPFGFWIGPMGPLLLDEESRARFTASEESYRTACSSREIRRATTRACISDHTFSMSTFMGLDNREILPPFMPVQRGEDLVFGTTLWTCARNAFFGHLPRTLLHAPEDRRSFWQGELLRTASGIDTARLMIALVDALDPGGDVGNRAACIRGLGERLIDRASQSSTDFIEFCTTAIGRSSDRFVSLLQATLERHDGSPDYWARDLRDYLRRLRQAKDAPDYVVPLDLRINRSREEARALTQKLVAEFGRLLVWWPEICDAARDLKRRGRGLSAPVS